MIQGEVTKAVYKTTQPWTAVQQAPGEAPAHAQAAGSACSEGGVDAALREIVLHREPCLAPERLPSAAPYLSSLVTSEGNLMSLPS